MAEEDDLAHTIAEIESAATRRGLSLTVHALKRAQDVLKWELAADREKALKADRGGSVKGLGDKQSSRAEVGGLHADQGRD